MAKDNKKLVQAITSQEENFAQWYTDICVKAELVEYSSVKGFIILRPYGQAIWELIQKDLDARFKATGHENVAMPVLMPESLLKKEGELVNGFAPEVAWVTMGGSEKLEERLAVRPTSETLFCDHWSRVLHSYRELPMKYNQWCSVIRWEKTTRPFLRSREFWWQEGHTIHETAAEAEAETQQQLNCYADVCEQDLAIPVVKGRKTDKEKFAGAEATYTIEAMMKDGKALQSGTSHYFGDKFSKAYDVTFTGRDNQLHHPFQTSWGVSTRLVGAIIMTHGDDDGLILPPAVAPIQVVVVPIAAHKPGVSEKAAELAEKMRRGMRESALKGQAISRCRALGLKTDEHKRFVIDEKTAPTVRFIFEHYAAGESAMSIVEQLNAKGLRTSQGNPFNKSSIPRIIQNEAYRGVYISKSYDVRIEGAIPAIIDDELWERAQTMLKLNRQLKAKNEPKADYILSGKLYCSCGSLMRGMSGHSATGEVYRYYTCPNKDCHLRNIPKDDLEGKVMQSIVDHLLQPESMEALAEAMVEVQKADVEKPNAERVAIEQSLSDVRRRSKNILDAIENGTANAQLCARLDDLTEQERTLNFQLSALEKEKPVVFTKEQYLFLLEQFLVEPSERTPEYGRRLVNTFVTSMVVSDRELVINFNVSEETVNKNKKTSQTNLQKESSSGMRLVRVARIELTAS